MLPSHARAIRTMHTSAAKTTLQRASLWLPPHTPFDHLQLLHAAPFTTRRQRRQRQRYLSPKRERAQAPQR